VCSARGCLVLCCFQIFFIQSQPPVRRDLLSFFGRAAGARREHASRGFLSSRTDHAPTDADADATRASGLGSGARPAPTPRTRRTPAPVFPCFSPRRRRDEGENSWVGAGGRAAPRGVWSDVGWLTRLGRGWDRELLCWDTALASKAPPPSAYYARGGSGRLGPGWEEQRDDGGSPAR
jgi:hypothetical protein